MSRVLPASVCLLWLVSSAHAGPFEDCDLGTDFDFFPRLSVAEADRRIRACSEFIRQAPRDTKRLTSAYISRGVAYVEMLQPERAIADYNKAIEIVPRNAEAYYRRGNAYAVLDRNHERAIRDHSTAIEIDPGHKWAYGRRAYEYELQRNYSRSIADYTKHIEVNPRDAVKIYSLRARVHVLMNEYDRAIADYSKLIEIDPRSSSVYSARARAYFAKKDHDRAIADYSREI